MTKWITQTALLPFPVGNNQIEAIIRWKRGLCQVQEYASNLQSLWVQFEFWARS